MFWKGFGVGMWGACAGLSAMIIMFLLLPVFGFKLDIIPGVILFISCLATFLGLCITSPIDSYKKIFLSVFMAAGIWFLLYAEWFSNLILPEFELGVIDNQLQAINLLKRLGISIIMTGLTAGMFSKIVKLPSR